MAARGNGDELRQGGSGSVTSTHGSKLQRMIGWRGQRGECGSERRWRRMAWGKAAWAATSLKSVRVENDEAGLLLSPLVAHLLLLLAIIQHSCSLGTYSSSSSINQTAKVPYCRPDQASALLRLRGRSFSPTNDSACTLASWRPGTDCCAWEGIACSTSTAGGGGGRVTTLDLGGCWLEISAAGLHPALFDLTSPQEGFSRCQINHLAVFTHSSRKTDMHRSENEILMQCLGYLDLSKNSLNANDSELPAAGFERLTELTHLNLSYPGFTGDIPHGIRRLNKLASLDLSNWIYLIEADNDYFLPLGAGRWPVVEPDIGSLLANLSNLRVLDLGNVDLSGNGAAWCDGLANSTPRLEVLRLRNTHLDAPICRSLSAIRSLVEINLKFNKLHGRIPDSLADLPSLGVLRLAYNLLQGPFPMRIFGNKNLRVVDISYNFRLSGVLPDFSSGSALTELLCSNTNLSGPIASSVSNLKSLKSLGVAAAGDSHQEELPSSIGELRSLTSLQLSGSGIVGEMPSWVANLTSLETLQFSNCGLSGQLPSFIGNLKNLSTLKLYACNFSGQVPPHLFNLTNLEVINLHSNGFIGTIELSSFFKLPNLSILNLSNNKLSVLVREHNSSWEPINNFDTLCLASCNISKLPDTLRHMQSVQVLDLSSNHIHGTIPQWAWDNWINSLILMNLSHNQFSGSIGYGSVISDGMFVIDISYNLFEGNQLGGRLPNSLKQDCAFGALDFSDNRIEGLLPRSLVACKDLEAFDIRNNRIDDTFPCWMSMLPKLQVLVLKSNKFVGNVGPSVPGDKNSFNETLVMENQYDLLGQTYQITTAITYKGSDITFSKILRTIVVIDVSDNAFYGAIPQSIGDLVLLSGVNMSHNALTGLIPSQLGMLHQLESLDLSSNDLSGEIPQELASLDFLSTLNMSYNKLEGRIPESPHFLTFSNLSFLGNMGLCGLQLSKACNNISSDTVLHQSEKVSIDIVLFLFAGLGFGVGFAIAILLTWGTSRSLSLALQTVAMSYQDNALSSTRPATSPNQLQYLKRGHAGSMPSLASSDRCPCAYKQLNFESSSTQICVPISSS
uniref:non-specific serine/threonine protein kinase n=1 Tax=Oryza meridionalis TaxID=40149 RepID=A0A0E0DCT1_9ORYZ